MGYKHTDACLDKVADDEPIFVLRGQDKLAPALVRLWADLAELHGCDPHKLFEARLLAGQMDCWPTRKLPD
jgi:hypothetical protein